MIEEPWISSPSIIARLHQSEDSKNIVGLPQKHAGDHNDSGPAATCDRFCSRLTPCATERLTRIPVDQGTHSRRAVALLGGDARITCSPRRGTMHRSQTTELFISEGVIVHVRGCSGVS